MNRPQVCMRSTPILNHPPTSFPTLSLWVVPEQRLWMPCIMLELAYGRLFYIW